MRARTTPTVIDVYHTLLTCLKCLVHSSLVLDEVWRQSPILAHVVHVVHVIAFVQD